MINEFKETGHIPDPKLLDGRPKWRLADSTVPGDARGSSIQGEEAINLARRGGKFSETDLS
jgi:hypothetical protein